KISKPADIPPEVLRYILERWSEHMKPIRHKFVEAGLVGKTFTEKAPDMPLGRLNYTFTEDGTWKFDFESKEDIGQTIITYVDFEKGYRALADENYDYMKAFQEGIFKLEPSAEDALKMAPMMPDMVKAFIKAIEDAEKKFNMELPKY
ncbi:MAG: hypothetical protein ACE5K3_08545, partial [bacterium]